MTPDADTSPLGMHPLRAVLLAMTIVFGTSGCDGGLSGTGDGTEPPVESTGPADGGLFDLDDADTQPEETTPDADGDGETPPTLAFENLLTVTSLVTPRLVVANTTSAPIDFRLDADAAIRVVAGAVAGPIPIATGRNRLSLLDTTGVDVRTLAVVDPFDAASGSVSTVVWRHDGERSVPLPLVTEVEPADPALARVRLALGSTAATAIGRWRFAPVTGATGSEVETGGEPDDTTATGYVDIQPGTYRAQSMTPPAPGTLPTETRPLTLDAGRVYTIVMSDRDALLLDDRSSLDTVRTDSARVR